jgi:hypothetical protein
VAKPTKTTTPPVTTIDLAAFLADLDKCNDRMLDGRIFSWPGQDRSHSVGSGGRETSPSGLARTSRNRRVSGKQQRNIKGRWFMDFPPSFMIKFCFARAAECRRKAEQATDFSQQRSWRETEGRWFFLARSYANERRADIISLRAS